MVRAILAGEKTQTRRVVKPLDKAHQIQNLETHGRTPERYSGKFNDPASWGFPYAEDGEDMPLDSWAHLLCPYGQPGDRLWVRETHAYLDVTRSHLSCFPVGNGQVGPVIWNVQVEYADGVEHGRSAEGILPPKQTRERGDIGWRPSIFMHRWASRIDLELTGVRAQRLQDISEADASAEGAKSMDIVTGRQTLDPNSRQGSYIAHYRHIWDSINGKTAPWASNPWVWVLTFNRA